MERATALPYFRSKARLRQEIRRFVWHSSKLSSSLLLLLLLVRRVSLLLSVGAILCEAHNEDICIFADESQTENASEELLCNDTVAMNSTNPKHGMADVRLGVTSFRRISLIEDQVAIVQFVRPFDNVFIRFASITLLVKISINDTDEGGITILPLPKAAGGTWNGS